MPTVALPLPAPSTVQVTLVFEDPVTVAVNCCVASVTTVTLGGETETVIAGAGRGERGGTAPVEPPPQLARNSARIHSRKAGFHAIQNARAYRLWSTGFRLAVPMGPP